ncbi:MAG: hypothetical protein H6623_02685 [Bdellovibrionaceae bacterium]|nr:hypothetical protein [Pseudobdellovibrionaceae bacterium]
MRTTFLILIIFCSACTNLQQAIVSKDAMSGTQYENLKTIISKGDTGRTKAALNSLPNGLPQYTCLLNETLDSTSYSDFSSHEARCKSDIIKDLIAKGAVVSEARKNINLKNKSLLTLSNDSTQDSCEISHSLTKAVQSGCIDNFNLISNALDKSDLVFVAKNNAPNLPAPPVKELSDTRYQNKLDYYNNITKLYGALLSRLKPLCSSNGPLSDDCLASDNIYNKLKSAKEEITKIDKAKADEDEFRNKQRLQEQQALNEINSQQQRANSPNGLFNRACDQKRHIATITDSLNQEREVGKRSGYINPNTIHQLTTAQIYAEKTLKGYEDSYQKKTGSKINFKDCP